MLCLGGSLLLSPVLGQSSAERHQQLTLLPGAGEHVPPCWGGGWGILDATPQNPLHVRKLRHRECR